MSGESAAYAKQFFAGRRVRLAVPLAEGAPFQEWGKVCSLERDLVEIELSRDLLHPQACLQLGRTIHLNLLDGTSGLGCNGSLIALKRPHRLVLRLLDQVAPYEQREFYRQDLSLQLDFRLPPSQLPQEIRERWRQCRWAAEFASQLPDPGEAPELDSLRKEILAGVERREAAPPVAVNISGGGMRLNMKERLHPGILVELGIYLPPPRKVLEVVGEVVQVTASADRDHFSTALRYRLIDEADRDRLIAYISAQQMWQLSQQPVRPAAPAPAPYQPSLGARRLAVGLLLLTAFLGCQVRSTLVARERGEKQEIARLFDQAMLEFLRQRK
ncbi:PilZ-like domain-containing protein [Geomonas sp.]|uniref:PilZ-like domain-containing protein n=1 Tax=Geomonas sp. TaxID=2651584 RepID=UPI002B497F87|nr:PilZ-like domain-containing protein [Geomonas sp.]HJV34891.1 PilZ-like domain-containing protein [Geomonas sp.]